MVARSHKDFLNDADETATWFAGLYSAQGACTSHTLSQAAAVPASNQWAAGVVAHLEALFAVKHTLQRASYFRCSEHGCNIDASRVAEGSLFA